MNRRDFIRLAGLSLLAGFLPPINLESEMELGNIWVKIANKMQLMPNELEFLRLEGRNTQLANSQISAWKSGETYLNVKNIKSQDVFLERMPNSFLVLDKTDATTIQTNTVTEISNYQEHTPFTGDLVSTSNDFFELDSVNGRIYMKQSNRVIGFYIYYSFAENATGYRGARVKQYNRDGTFLTDSNAWRIPTNPDNTFTMSSTVFVPWGGTRDVGDYATLAVYQNSGGDLDLTELAYGAFVIR